MKSSFVVATLLIVLFFASSIQASCVSDCVKRYGDQSFFKIACEERCAKQTKSDNDEEMTDIAQALMVKLRQHYGNSVTAPSSDDEEAMSEAQFVKAVFQWIKEKLTKKKKTDGKKDDEEESDVDLKFVAPLVKSMKRHVELSESDSQGISDIEFVKRIFGNVRKFFTRVFPRKQPVVSDAPVVVAQPAEEPAEQPAEAAVIEPESDAALIKELIAKLKEKFGPKKKKSTKTAEKSAKKDTDDDEDADALSDAEAMRVADKIKEFFGKIKSTLLKSVGKSRPLSDSELAANIIAKLKTICKKGDKPLSEYRHYDWNKIHNYIRMSDEIIPIAKVERPRRWRRAPKKAEQQSDLKFHHGLTFAASDAGSEILLTNIIAKMKQLVGKKKPEENNTLSYRMY